MTDIAVRHTLTNIVSTIPEAHLNLFKDGDGNSVFVKVSDTEIAQMRKDAEVRMYGKPYAELADESPSMAWTKADIIAYAESHNLAVDESATKTELLETIASAEGAA